MITTDDCGAGSSSSIRSRRTLTMPTSKRSLAFVRCTTARAPPTQAPATLSRMPSSLFITSRPHIDALYKKVERGESDVVKKYKDDQKAVISSVAK